MFIYERHFLGEYLIPRHFKLLSRLEATTGELDTGKCSLPPQTLALDSRASDKQICCIVCVRNEFVLLKCCLNFKSFDMFEITDVMILLICFINFLINLLIFK